MKQPTIFGCKPSFAALALLFAALSLGPVIVPAQAQTAFVTDALSDTPGTALSAHTGQTGATWTAIPAAGTASVVATASPAGYFRGAGADGYEYLASGTAPTPNYTVTGTFYVAGAGTNGNAGFTLRSDTNGNGYRFVYSLGSTEWVIYKVTGNSTSFNALAVSPQVSYATASSHTLAVTLNGTSISGTVDGAAILSTTDPTFTAAGQVGLTGNSTGNGTDTSGFLWKSFSATYTPPNQTIYADNLDWVNSPYNINLVGSGASSVSLSVNPGSYHRINVINPTSAALTFSTATGASDIIDYRWDNAAWTRLAVAASVPLALPSNTTAGVSHLFEWAFGACPITSDRWTSSPPVNALQFTGLVLNGSASVSQPPVRPKKVLALGDSIREGQRTLAASGSSYPTSDWDATLSSSFALQDTLNAEVGLVGFSGQAVTNTTNSAPENVPALPSSYNLIYAGVPRVFTGASQPDLLTLCFGQNDGPSASSSAFLSGLNAVVAGVGAKHSLVMGDENGYMATAEQAVTGATYAPPAVIATNTNTTPTADTYDGTHPTATAQKAKMLPVETAAALPLLYPAGTSTPTYLAPTFTHNTSGQLVIAWPADSAATGYKVLRSIDGGNTYTVIVTVAAGTLTYTTSATPAGLTYYWHIVSSH